MSSPDPIELRLEIASMTEPILGRIGDRRGRTVEFRGWIELAAALERLTEADGGTRAARPKQG